VEICIFVAIGCSVTLLIPTVTCAIRSKGHLDPISCDWNAAESWTPNGGPNGAASVTSLDLSNTIDASISEDTAVSAITFTSAAPIPCNITNISGLTLGEHLAAYLNTSETGVCFA
jgi:hypothetical protein